MSITIIIVTQKEVIVSIFLSFFYGKINLPPVRKITPDVLVNGCQITKQ